MLCVQGSRAPSKGRARKTCIRKEIRTFSVEELANFKSAFNSWNTIIEDTVRGLTGRQLFIDVHRAVTSPGAHDAPSFLIYHREFLWK